MPNPKFYAVIIGTEILNGRREDAHFSFLKNLLAQKGYTLSGCLIIKDEKELMRETFSLLKNIENSVIFSFGGIGATPDDLTRQIAADVFDNAEIEYHPEFKEMIVSKHQEEAYPHRVNLAYIPKNSELLRENPINLMPGFSLQDRYFFVPGFPEMAHPMLTEAFLRLFEESEEMLRITLSVYSGEGVLIDLLEKVSKEIEVSSLPSTDAKVTEISFLGTPEKTASCAKKFKEALEKKGMDYRDHHERNDRV